MSDDRPNIFARAVSSMADFFIRWWREATGPLNRSQYRTLKAAVFRRVMLWVPVAVLVLAFAGSVAFYFFAGWRARDLAAKSLQNAEQGNLPMARLQAWSARNLRSGDPAVQRALAVVESKVGNPAAVDFWNALPAGVVLTPGELETRAGIMARAGSPEQFDRAVADLEAAGLPAVAARLRSDRELSQGDLGSAIDEVREAAREGDPPSRLALLRLLVTRYRPALLGSSPAPGDLAAGREIIGLVDALGETPQGQEALALGFGSQVLSSDVARRWAAVAWRDKRPANPALLPAAEVMARLGDMPSDAVRNQLNAIYAGAPAETRAALAVWLLRQGDAAGALEAASAKNAAQSTAAFIARAEALERLERWDELLALGDAGSSAPSSVRFAVRARAALALGRDQLAAKSLQDAVRSSLREGTTEFVLRRVDAMGEGKVADAELLQLCAEASTAEQAFRLARARFGARGQFASLDAAAQKASAAVPKSAPVADYRRFQDLLAGRFTDPQQTAAAVAADPKNVDVRITHALALLKAGRAREAQAVFDKFDVFVEALPPGQQAVAVAVIAANGEPQVAANLARTLDPHLLSPGEYALITPSLAPPR